MNLRLNLPLISAVGSLALLASCGGGGNGSLGPGSQAPELAPAPVQAEPDAVLDRFALYMDPASLLGDASIAGLRLESSSSETETILRVMVDGASELRAAYLTLEYDAGAYSPVQASAGDAIQGEALELPLLHQPGELHYGRVLVDPLAQPGFSGSGVLAEFSFANGSFDPADNLQPLARTASLAPPAQRFELISTDEPGMNYSMLIPYQLPGDYDQNSQVILSDLTPLAVHFGKKAPFEQGSVETVVDGDSNGEINIADISVIGANFQNSFTALSTVYGDQEDYDSSSPALIQDLLFGDAQGVASEDRLWFRSDFNLDDVENMPLVWTILDGSAGGSPVVDKPSVPLAFETEGQRVMSLNAQVFPLQPSVGEEVSVYVNSLDAEAAITQVVLDYGGESVVEDVTFEGEAQLLRFTHVFDSPGEYPVKVSFRQGPAAEPRAGSLVRSVYSRSFTVNVHGPFSDPPLAGLELTPAMSAKLGTQLALSAGLSNPGGGSSITNYEWDFNGDGIFDEEGEASATTFDATSADVDLGHVSVRVTADNGEQDTATMAYIFNTADATTPQVELTYDGPLQFSDTNVQLGGLGGVVNGLGDKLGGLESQFGNFQGQIKATDPLGAVSVHPYDPGTPLSIDLSGAGDHLLEFQLLFAGAVLGSDSITVTLGARAIELEVFPAVTTIKAPVFFTATPENPELIDHYVFDFGDGNQLNSPNATVTHEYTVKQDYVATVTAFWTDDKQNTSAGVDVICGFERMVELEVDTNPGLLNQELNFTASVDFPELVTEYTYEFGDGNATTTTETSVPHTYLSVGNYKPFLICVYSDGPTTLSDKLSLDVQDPGQLVTEPLLEIVSETGDFPKLVEFTAKNTKFKVGTSLLSFSIDFGDGSSKLNVTDINQSVWHAYYEPGNYTATLTVRDTDFEQNTDDIEVSVVDPGGKFDYTVIGGTPNTFEIARMEAVLERERQLVWSARAVGGSDGWAVKHDVNSPYHLYIANPADASATSWSTPVKIAEPKGTEGNFSAALTSGGPAVAYYEYKSIDDPFPADGDLMFANSTALDGSVWDAPVTVSAAGDIGRYPALAYINNKPAVTSRLSTSLTDGTAKYVQATAADGSSWGSLLDIGADGVNEAWFSMISGSSGSGSAPVVAMQINNGGQYRLGFQSADDNDGTSWTPAETVFFSSIDRGYGIDLEKSGANMGIAFQDSIAGRIYFTYSANLTGDSWSMESVVIDLPEGSAPGAFSLFWVNDKPFVIVTAKGGPVGAPEPVYLVSATDTAGSSWADPEFVGWTSEHHAVANGIAEDGSQLVWFYDHLSAIGGTGVIRSGSRMLP